MTARSRSRAERRRAAAGPSSPTGILPSLGSPLGGLGGIAAMLIRGLDAARPELGVSLGLSDRTAALYPRTLTDCLPELAATDSFGGVPGTELLRPGIDTSAVTTAFGANDPEDLRIPTPVRVAQGGKDTTVLPPFSEQLRDEYRERGNRIAYTAYPDATHGGVVDAAAKRSVRWLRAWLRR